MAAQHLFNCPVPDEPHDWKCSACREDFKADIDDLESLPWHANDGTDNLACAGCIRSRFQEALKSGIIWPARWVTTFLDPQHYRHILGDELYEAYNAKERVKAAEPPPDTPPIPDGLTRGVEVQICPNPGCKKLIGLRDGCNHIICEACVQNFCFLCDKQAFDGSGHWTKDGCPRFGPRGALNPVHDPQPNETEDDVFVTDRHITHWNVAMQTSDLATQNILRRFVDASGPEITDEHLAVATAALGTFHSLNGIPEADWNTPRATALRTAHDSQFLEMLLLVRDSEMNFYEAPQPDDSPDTHIYANVVPFRQVLRVPLAQVFDMSTVEVRNDAYNWIAMRLREPSNENFGTVTREDSAILTNIPPLHMTRFINACNQMNLRLHAVRFHPTAVILEIHGDLFGPVHALVDGVNPMFGTPRHFADTPRDFRRVLNHYVWRNGN
jgi:hypothetical protein